MLSRLSVTAAPITLAVQLNDVALLNAPEPLSVTVTVLAASVALPVTTFGVLNVEPVGP